MAAFANIVLVSQFKVFVDGQHVADVQTPGLVPAEERFKSEGLQALARCKAAFKDGLKKSRKKMFVLDGQQDSGAADADNLFTSVYGDPWVHDLPAPAIAKDGSGPGIGVLKLVSVAEDVPKPVKSGNRRPARDKLQVGQLTTTASAESPLSNNLIAQNTGRSSSVTLVSLNAGPGRGHHGAGIDLLCAASRCGTCAIRCSGCCWLPPGEVVSGDVRVPRQAAEDLEAPVGARVSGRQAIQAAQSDPSDRLGAQGACPVAQAGAWVQRGRRAVVCWRPAHTGSRAMD